MSALIGIFFKGVAMGAANVIPGVSGGTIAFITGIYERLIRAINAVDVRAVRLLVRFRLRELAAHVDLSFLVALGAGVLAGILSLAKLLEYLFATYPVYLWAFFFGLILASVAVVARSVGRWGAGPVVSGILGLAVAVGIALLRPVSENPNPLYVLLCGVVAISSMIIPGLSGSFVLILMGNYMLILGAVSGGDLGLLFPFLVGCGVGILALARVLAWVFKRHHDTAVALITGFVAGSLLLIWPWKEALLLRDAAGAPVIRKGEDVVSGYAWHLPAVGTELFAAVGLMAAGAVLVLAIERLAAGGADAKGG